VTTRLAETQGAMARELPSPVERSARVSGSGVTALTCARLLGVQGWQIEHDPGGEARPVHLLLGQATANLLAALWSDPALLRGAHRIRERAVYWNRGKAVAPVAAPGLVMAADELVRRLASRATIATSSRGSAPGWIVSAQAPQAGASSPAMREIGRRHAWIAHATLAQAALRDRCLMESIDDGWLFLLPVGAGNADLQYVSLPSDAPPPAPEFVIEKTTMIRQALSGIAPWRRPIACMPKVHLAPARRGVLAVGEGALAFDPISGDGVGHALRSVVLAATTLDAMATGRPVGDCLNDYAATLHRAMAHHLRICLDLYDNTMFGPGWRSECDAMRAALAELDRNGRGATVEPT
jgi:hypothetical protein